MKPLLCYVTDQNALAEPALLMEQISRAVVAGVDWVQIREKDLSARELLELARAAVKVARSSATRIIVNDRLDVALAAGAGGVHLGETSVPVAAVSGGRHDAAIRDASLSGFLIGASCHSLEAVRVAEHDGADYIIFGPVFSTPSKEKFGAPQGINRLAEASKAVRIPVLAIGGVAEQNARACFDAGAAGVAAIRMFSETPDLAALVERLRSG